METNSGTPVEGAPVAVQPSYSEAWSPSCLMDEPTLTQSPTHGIAIVEEDVVLPVAVRPSIDWSSYAEFSPGCGTGIAVASDAEEMVIEFTVPLCQVQDLPDDLATAICFLVTLRRDIVVHVHTPVLTLLWCASSRWRAAFDDAEREVIITSLGKYFAIKETTQDRTYFLLRRPLPFPLTDHLVTSFIILLNGRD